MTDKPINIDYQHFFDMAVDMLCVANFDGYFLHVNDAFTRVLGYSREELMSQPFVNFIHPDDVEPTIAEAQKLSEGGIVHTFVNRYRHKDGSYRIFEWTSHPDLSQSLIYGTVRDITQFKVNQQELIELKNSLEQQVKDRTQELNFHNTSLNKLLELASSEEESLEDSIEAYLSMGCELTGMETGVISMLEDGQYLAKYVFQASGDPMVIQGRHYSPAEALCHQVIEFDRTVHIPNLPESSIKNHQACIESGVQSYLGTLLVPDGQQTGTLSFLSSCPRHLPFVETIKSVLEIMARLLASKIKLSEVQEKLILSQQKYEELYHTAPDMMGSVDPKNGRFVAVNQSMANKFGRKVEEMIGTPVFDIYHPDSLAKARKAFQQFTAHKQVHNVELQILDKDGKKVDVELNAKLVENGSGEVLYSSSILRDISQRKTLERELNYSENRFRALAESMPIGISLLSQSGKIVYTNPAQSRILGYDRVELQNAHFTDYIYKTDSIWNYDFLVRIIENQKSYSQVIELRHREKSSIWCKVTLAGMDPGPKREARVIITAEDITEQKQNAIALEEAYDALRDTNEELQVSNQELRFYQSKLEILNLKLTEQKQLLESGEQICKMSTWLFDPATGKTEFSSAYLDVHGFVEKDINEDNATAMSISRIHPLDKAKMDHYREELKSAPLPLSETYRYIMGMGL